MTVDFADRMTTAILLKDYHTVRHLHCTNEHEPWARQMVVWSWVFRSNSSREIFLL